MPLGQIRELIEQNKDNQEVQNYLKGLNPITPEGVSAFLETEDGAKLIQPKLQAYLDSEDGKKLVQPKLDQHFTKGLETWKQNNLQKLIDEEITKRYPEDTEDQKLLKKLQADLEAEKQARVRETLRNKAITTATEKGLPVQLIDHFLGQDEDATLANIGNFEKVWQEHLQTAVEAKFKTSGREPHKDTDEPPTTLTKEQIEKMSPDEINKRWSEIEPLLAQGKL